MSSIERKGRAHFGARAAGGKRWTTGELTQLAGNLAGMMSGNRGLTMQTVATDDFDRAFKNQPCRRIRLADIEDELAGSKLPCGTAGKTLCGLDLAGIEHRKHLMTAGADSAHDAYRSCRLSVGEPAGLVGGICSGWRLVRLKGGFDCIVGGLEPNEIHGISRRLGDVLIVLLVAFGQYDSGNAGAKCCKHLVLDAANRKHKAAQRNLAGHGEAALYRLTFQQRDQRDEHGDAGARAILGDGACRHVEMNIRFLKDLGVDAE